MFDSNFTVPDWRLTTVDTTHNHNLRFSEDDLDQLKALLTDEERAIIAKFRNDDTRNVMSDLRDDWPDRTYDYRTIDRRFQLQNMR